MLKRQNLHEVALDDQYKREDLSDSCKNGEENCTPEVVVVFCEVVEAGHIGAEEGCNKFNDKSDCPYRADELQVSGLLFYFVVLVRAPCQVELDDYKTEVEHEHDHEARDSQFDLKRDEIDYIYY